MKKETDNIYIHYHLQLFAKGGEGGDKTEDATSKKLTDARKDGQVARSTELVTALALMALFLVLKIAGGFVGSRLLSTFTEFYGLISSVGANDFDRNAGNQLFEKILLDIVIIVFPIFLTAMAAAFVGNFAQFKWQVTGKPLMPKFNKINPITGMKRLISMDKLMELLKSVLKIIVIYFVVYEALKEQWDNLLRLYDMGLFSAVLYVTNLVIDLGIKISALFLVIGFADLIYQKLKFKKDMKMSKQEVKDEYKNSEGDPQIKGQIRNKMREASQRRMMQELPQADVVITNPTHLAVALKYDKESASAPMVIAKGADFLAQRMKDVAKENAIAVVENKPLARMLYHNVNVGTEIPQELYQMVAEVLAYVYGLSNPD